MRKDTDQFARVEPLFWAAVELPAAQRRAFLVERCPDDTALVEEVMAMLEHLGDEDRRSYVQRLRQRAEQAAEQPASQSERIGPYQLLQVLGQGGMGTVYLAEQREPVRRRVALKVIKLGMDSKSVLARFDAERQALSMMDHVAVARIFDAGISEQGRPWFAMEYVKGIPITDYCDQNKLSVDQRIDLFRQVCSGVQHAHLKGIMHRDLKPGNVMVSVQEERPMPKIIDFGLAKAVDHRLIEQTLFTEHGQIMGTLEYMSPEQAGLSGLDVDTRSDVYSLGVLLYELLTGELPFSRQQLRTAHPFEVQRIIRETDPPKPSTRFTTLGASATEVARRRGTEASALGRTLRGELDWIVMKALEKDRTRRYSTALELAADLDRHQQHLPVLAGAPSLGHRLRKYVRRHRVQVGAMALLAVATLATTTSLVIAKEKSAAFQQIAGLVVHKRTLDAERELHPPWPDKLPAITRWLDHDYAALASITDRLPQARDQLRARSTQGANSSQPTFADSADALLWDALEQLTAGLPDLEQRRASVEARRDWARQVEAASVQRLDLWQPAIDAIARSTKYGGLRLLPQMGLVPIGENPATRLWEFYELRSACERGADPARVPIPVHGADGSIEVEAGTGIVFVLLPGGEFAMGANPGDENVGPSERHQVRVTIGPFLLARHELTQGQWQRLSFDRAHTDPPSYFNPLEPTPGLAPIGWAHPVEQVSWREANALLTDNGLLLPTEAQWEYACRAGGVGRWSCGDDVGDLPAVAHLHGLHDGDPAFLVHVTVGSLGGNAFGLHDMHGNVLEWCRDVKADYLTVAARPGDGLRPGEHVRGKRIVRGGSWDDEPIRARSSNRYSLPPDTVVKNLGLRAARALD